MHIPVVESMKRAMRAITREIEHKLKLGKNWKPFYLWALPEKRLAAPPVATRQCKRNELFRAGFDFITQSYPGERRTQRRKMARALAKRSWRAMLDRAAREGVAA